MRRYIILFLIIAVTFFVQDVFAVSMKDYAQGLSLSGKQRQTLEQIRNAANPSLKGLLTALKEGALYTWQDKFLILDADGNFNDLEGNKLLDTAGKNITPEEGLEAVLLEETNIPFLQQVLDVIDLSDENQEIRKSAALRLGNSQDTSSIYVLDQAIAREKNNAVRTIMLEVVNKFRLLDSNSEQRLKAVEFFEKNHLESALAPLGRLIATENIAAIKSKAEQVLKKIKRYVQLRSIIGYLFNGLSLSSVLLIMSLGLGITFGLMGIINMAHGEMLMLGSYTAYVLQELFFRHLPGKQDYYFFFAIPLSFLLVGCVGLFLERGILRFLYRRPLESLLVTWGVGMIFQQGARLFFGDQTSVNPPAWFRGGWQIMPGLILPYSRIFIIILSILCLTGIYFFLYRTKTGLKIRAVMQNREMAACLGISTGKIDAFTFALGTALAGLGGCALALIGTVDPEVGKTYIVDSFMVVVLGGVGKLLGTVMAALGIGMTNKLLEPAIPGTAAAVYAKVGILILVILFLQFRPSGIFAIKGRTSKS